MSDNKYTRWVSGYHKRQNAMGLCRSCPNPVVPGRTQCEPHLAKQRERRNAKAGGMSHKERSKRAGMIAQFALDNPFMSLKAISEHFGMADSTIYGMMHRKGVTLGWMRRPQ